MSTRWRRGLDRLAGPALLSWPTFWLVLALSFVLTYLSSSDLFRKAPVAATLAIVLGQVAMFAALLAAGPLLRRVSEDARAIPTLAAIGIATILRGAVLAVALMVLGVQSPPLWGLRVGGSLIGNSLVLILVTLVVGSVREHRERMTLYGARHEALARARARIAGDIETTHRDAVDRVRRELLTSLDSLADAPPDSVRDALRTAVDDVVRPLSHDLAANAIAPEQLDDSQPQLRIDWRSVAADATLDRPLPPITLAATLVSIGAIWCFTTMPSTKALLVLALGFAGIWIQATAINEVMARAGTGLGALGRSITLTACLVLMGVLTGAAARLVVGNYPQGTTIAVSDVVLLPVLGWLFAAARAARNQGERLEMDLQQVNEDLNWEVVRAGAVEWQQRQTLSRALHGPVQSAIGGAAIRLDMAIQSGEDTSELIAELRGNITTAVELLDRPNAPMDPVATVEQLRATYSGVCDVALQATADALQRLSMDTPCTSAVNAIVTEATWNAIRHGRAGCVMIALDTHGASHLQVRVHDDGTWAPVDSERHGLGNWMFDQLTTSWSIDSGASGTTLIADLPLQ